MKLYSIREFAEKLGVSVSTLRAWDREGKLVPLRTPTNKRRYTEDMFYQALGIGKRKEKKKEDLFAQFGCEILVVNKAEDMSPAQELVEDLISIVQHFAAKLYGSRTYRTRKLTNAVREELAGATDDPTKEPAAES
ncbi:MerR family DNA-binding transcriptional regulator [Kyrpidia tusciae]|uniref:Regulatory protein MerR n=1 Tax=Kyrpidia tusciae (strain DSM 2912 / NBRC 15312 / T2) TaxID=562970 RepID=D5WXW2_KYRT2|nr:MerR family DNA-binding transcriptional regulator [Kyrpidia tusciae]ADG06021.1 regulatory protein MerR [Kyrpidia tusciae DSM 2912]